MEDSAKSALLCLQDLGFRVEVVPTSNNSRRADIRAWHGDEEYIVEAKGRDLGDVIQNVHRRARAEGFAEITRLVQPSNAFSKKLLGAGNQLRQTPSGPGAFQLIWVFAAHDDENFEIECIEKRLHGIAELVVVNPKTLEVSTRPCFYYSGNDFRRMQHVHGAILCCRSGLRLLLNSFCPSREQFRSSSLYRRFADSGVAIDPELLESDGAAFVIGADFSSNGAANAQWAYIKAKYGALTSKMMETQFNAVAVCTLPKPQ